MILQRTDQPATDITDIKGLVIIDCWNVPEVTEWLEHVKYRFDLNNFDSIVVANYELKLDGDDICQQNLLEFYSRRQFTPDILLSMIKYSGGCITHPWLQSRFNDRCFLILESKDMIHHVQNTAAHVQDWLVVGWRWKECTHTRPLGFYNMRFMPYNFYITDWSMVGVEQNSLAHLQQDRLGWIDHSNNLFQLKKYDTR